jgi:hypothetical protein
MANLSSVGAGQATSHYLQQPVNWFTILPTAYYLGGRLLPFAGLNVPAWAKKVSDTATGSFMIYELGKVLSSPFSLAQDAKVGYKVIWSKKTAEDAREEQKGDFPRSDNPMKISPKVWTAYRLAGTTFKFASSGLAVYSWLKSEAKVHPWFKVAGPALGGAAYLIDIADRKSRIRDHAKDPSAEHAMIKDKKNGVDLADKVLLNGLLPKHWRGDQMVFATFFVMKAVATMLALKELVKNESLAGRAFQLVKTHQDDIWGALFTATVATTATQHLRTGATLVELTKRSINKA